MNKNQEKILKLIKENKNIVENEVWYKFNYFSEKFIDEIDKLIKKNFSYQWFWLYEIKNQFKWYWQIQVLTYYSRSDEFEIIDNDIIIYVIKKRIKKEINNEDEILNNINLYLWKISNSIIFNFFSKIDIQKYKKNQKLFRIILYIKKILNQCEDITPTRKQHQQEIILWNKNFWLKNFDKILWISDYWFWKNEIWNPEINFDNKLLEEIDFWNDTNKKYFKEQLWIYFDKKTWEEIERIKYYKDIANTKDAISSAFLEWYNKDTKNWKKAIENIFKLYWEFTWKEEFNIDFLIKVQKIVIEWLNDNLNWKKISNEWLRNWYVWIFQQKWLEHMKYNDLIYWAPKPEHIYIMLNNLCFLFNKYIQEKIHPVIISIIISFLFVKIHPFNDWNWRTARFLQVWILKKLNYIRDYYNSALSQSIIHESKWYYEMFDKSNLPIKEKIEPKFFTEWNLSYFAIEYENFKDYYWMNFNEVFKYFLDIYNKSFYLSILNHQYYLKKDKLIKLIKKEFWDNLNKKQENFIIWILKDQVKYDNNYELWNNIKNKMYKRLFEYEEIEKIEKIFQQLKEKFSIIKIWWKEKIWSNDIYKKTKIKNKKLDLE